MSDRARLNSFYPVPGEALPRLTGSSLARGGEGTREPCETASASCFHRQQAGSPRQPGTWRVEAPPTQGTLSEDPFG